MKTTDSGSRGDFLSTVIDRAHGRGRPDAPLVAPRPASLFEPGATSIAEAVESEAAAPPSPASPRADAPFVREPVPRIAPPHAADPARAAPATSPPPAMQQIVHAQHFHIAAEMPAPHVRPAAATQALAVPATPPRIAPAHDDVAATAPRAVHDAAPEPRRDNAIVPRIDAPMPRVAALLPNRDVVAAFAAQAPSLAVPSREAAAPTAPSPGPVVTISIGRVEVRAPAATPAATRTAAQPRPAALSDYLGRKERAR